MPEVRNIDYFETKARQCFRLAASCTDPNVAHKLRELGYEFVGKALELGANPAYMPRLRYAPDTKL